MHRERAAKHQQGLKLKSAEALVTSSSSPKDTSGSLTEVNENDPLEQEPIPTSVASVTFPTTNHISSHQAHNTVGNIPRQEFIEDNVISR